MRRCLETLDRKPPKLIVAYAQALYELACFARRENITITPQNAAITSAGTLYEFMREAIVNVLRCPVYNRYGSREVSDIACERPGLEGLWVAPWGNYVEVLDSRGRAVPPDTDGEIAITCLTNFAMPLVRYRIGDRGTLAASKKFGGQVLSRVLGRTVDTFRLRDGTCVDGEYFTHLLYFRDWVQKFQIVQKDYDTILIKIKLNEAKNPSNIELTEITANTRAVMGPACHVRFEFPPEIPSLPSGKYRFTLSEVV